MAEVERANARLQPVLVGTASIEKSELLGEYLKKHGYKQIDFATKTRWKSFYAAPAPASRQAVRVLNARFHEQEAYIVAEAGVPGAITIATNMAGRGTDIKLGGSLDMRIMHETAGSPTRPRRPPRSSGSRPMSSASATSCSRPKTSSRSSPQRDRSRPRP